ncbi:unnamed protein product, partial [Sphagnum tenellum]
EPHIVGSGSSFYAGINNSNLDTSGINGGDLGVVYAATGLPFTRVASSPTTGQYVAPVQVGTVATPTALAWSAGVATVTATTTNLQVGMVVTITGCTPSAYNGTWTVASVTGTTAFTFALPLAATPGSGTVFGSVTVNPSYQFSTGDAGASVLITYRYTVTGGQTIIINNQQLGYTPIFQLDYVTVPFATEPDNQTHIWPTGTVLMADGVFQAFAQAAANLTGNICFTAVNIPLGANLSSIVIPGNVTVRVGLYAPSNGSTGPGTLDWDLGVTSYSATTGLSSANFPGGSDLTTGTSINAQFATLGLGGSPGSNTLSVTGGNGSTQGSALFNNNAGQFTFTVNRNTGSYNAACAFQTNYTTQAQFGLLGNNNLSFQVGTGFTTGLTLDNATAIPSFPTAPKFSATNSSAQTLTTASTAYTLLAQTVNYQVGSNYNASTGIFTAPIAGYYQFYVSCKISGITSATATSPVNGNIQFYLNGSALAYTNEVVTCYCSNTNISVSSSLLINLTAGQTVN